MTFKRLDKEQRLHWAEADLPAIDFEKLQLSESLCAHPVIRTSRFTLPFELISIHYSVNYLLNVY